MYTAEPVARLRDLPALQAIRDSIRVLMPPEAGPQELVPLRHVEGLVFHLEGRASKAEAAFRQAMISPVTGYTWTNLDLARVLIESGRPRAAIAPLRAALRHHVFAVSFADAFVPRAIVQAHLVHAWERAGEPDSAAAARREFERLWARAEPDARILPDPAVPDRHR
jgi:hypothetical protein